MRDILKTGGFIIQTREPHKAATSVLYWPNIYLDNFDKYMEEYALRFNKGKERHITKEYKQFSGKDARHP